MKIARSVCCFCLLLVGILAVSQPVTLRAQETPVEPKIQIRPVYTKVEGTASTLFSFEVELYYQADYGTEAREFDLVTTGPQDWDVYINPKYDKVTKLRGIRIDPSGTPTQSIVVVATPPVWLRLEPGEYPITLEVTSKGLKELKDSKTLTAVITATYILDLVPTNERYSTSALAGKDNYFSVEIQNNGSAAIGDITFSSDKPEGWTMGFSPEKVDSLIADGSQTIEVNIKPPPRTIAGDYSITLKAEGKQTKAPDFQIRVTVETPTIWGWVGVAIIVLVIAGIIFIFMRFSRR